MHTANDWTRLAETLSEQLRQGTDTATLLRQARRRLEGSSVDDFLEWLGSTPQSHSVQLVRLIQHLALTAKPIATDPNTTAYEWAGKTLQRLLETPAPVSETWPFFSGSQKPAKISNTATGSLSAITMEELVVLTPEFLGPQGVDTEHGNQKYFFVKFLDPSDFPPFAYVGFNPEAIGILRQQLEEEHRLRLDSDEAWRQALTRHVADLLWQDRQAVEALADLVRPRVGSSETFAQLKTAYKRWAMAQAEADWNDPPASDTLKAFGPFLDEAGGGMRMITSLLARTQQIRRRLIGLMHRINFAPDQAILVESPALHAIAGLSLQLHPKAPGNFHPKDEAWIYKPIACPDGTAGWMLVEPQRTFDQTESGADFFTPFAWTERGLGFRKAITRASLDVFVSIMDARPRRREDCLRTVEPTEIPRSSTRGEVRWYRAIEEAAWPYFVVRELRFSGAGEAVTPLAHHSFIELHATHGTVEIILSRGDGQTHRFTVTPAHPALLPASLPYETIAYRASRPANVLFFTRPTAS